VLTLNRLRNIDMLCYDRGQFIAELINQDDDLVGVTFYDHGNIPIYSSGTHETTKKYADEYIKDKRDIKYIKIKGSDISEAKYFINKKRYK
jgi:hypothetical protein